MKKISIIFSFKYIMLILKIYFKNQGIFNLFFYENDFIQIYASIYTSNYVALHNPLQFLKISFNIRFLRVSNFEHLYMFFGTQRYKTLQNTTNPLQDTTKTLQFFILPFCPQFRHFLGMIKKIFQLFLAIAMQTLQNRAKL